MKIGPADPRYAHVTELEPDAAHWKLGADVTIRPAEPEHTEQQRRGFFWLVDQWVHVADAPTQIKDYLVPSIYIAKWGSFRWENPVTGEKVLLPSRTMTRVWDVAERRYRPKRATRDEESDLIELTYRLAAECGVVLPELER